MATLNRSFATYIPNDNPLYAIPVQQGDVSYLTIALTPNGQGILGWIDATANEFRCAVVPEFNDCFTDDVVPAGDVRTVWSSGTRNVYIGSIWVWQGALYAFISHYLDGNGKVECYIADDIENPVVWTLRGTIRDHTTFINDTGGLTVPEGGIPTVDDSGRWLLPFHGWLSFAGRLEDALGLYTSDDDGVTWAIRISDRKSALSGGSAGDQSTTVGWEPSSGDYWFGGIIGPTTAWHPYSSNDDGNTWANNGQAGPRIAPHYYMDDGTLMYVAYPDADSMNLYSISAAQDPTDETTWTDLGMRGIVIATSYQFGLYVIPILGPSLNLLGVAFTADDRVAYHPLCVPVVPPPLFIPYKTRLGTLATDFTDLAISLAQSQQFDNLKTIERWAAAWMSLATDAERCRLFIPFKDHSTQPPDISAAQSFDNWKAIERWAYDVAAGGCGCGCAGATPPPDRCRLFVPFKSHLLNVDLLDPLALTAAAEAEFDNYKVLERWANRYARGECGCTV